MANSKLKGNEIVNIPANGDLNIFVQGEANFLALNAVKPLIPDADNIYTTIHFKLLFEGLIVGDGVIKTGEFFQLSNTPFNQIALSAHNHEFYKGKAIIATISYGSGVFNDTSTEFVNRELPQVVSELEVLNSRIGTDEFSLNELGADTVRKLNSIESLTQNIETLTETIKDSLRLRGATITQYINAMQQDIYKIYNKTVSDFPYKSQTKSTVAVNEYLTFDLNETDLISIDLGMNNLANHQAISYKMEFSNGNANDDFIKIGVLSFNSDNAGAGENISSSINTIHTTNWTTLKIKIIGKQGSLVTRFYCVVNSFKK